MNKFVLQNPDYPELYWDAEYGWVDLTNASVFTESETESNYCTSLSGKGNWVSFVEDYQEESKIQF
jgi:hypothetical protein